jgi:hypothetical protein
MDRPGTSLPKPVVSIDVAGHEMSHGVTHATSKLAYSRDAGGLNEATSDIFGTLVKYYANNANDPGNYVIGATASSPTDCERCTSRTSTVAPLFAIRGRLQKRKRQCTETHNTHYSSGVANRFFYLLAEGSRWCRRPMPLLSKNDQWCATAIRASQASGATRPGKIWYRTLTVYLNANSTYPNARARSIQAASDLYGANSAAKRRPSLAPGARSTWIDRPALKSPPLAGDNRRQSGIIRARIGATDSSIRIRTLRRRCHAHGPDDATLDSSLVRALRSSRGAASSVRGPCGNLQVGRCQGPDALLRAQGRRRQREDRGSQACRRSTTAGHPAAGRLARVEQGRTAIADSDGQTALRAPAGRPRSLSGGREDGTDASRCTLARDMLNGVPATRQRKAHRSVRPRRGPERHQVLLQVISPPRAGAASMRKRTTGSA